MDDMTPEEQAEFEREINACIIQKFWKRYIYQRAIIQTVKSLRDPIQVYYSNIYPVMKQKSDTDKLFYTLRHKKWPHYKCLLVDNKYFQSLCANELNLFPLPLIYIHDHYIGSFDDFEKLVEAELVDKIIQKQYLKKCLICDKPSKDECAHCGRPSLFFKKH